MKQYTVILLYPTCESYMTTTKANNVSEAVCNAKEEASCGSEYSSNDFEVVAVIAGKHRDIKYQS